MSTATPRRIGISVEQANQLFEEAKSKKISLKCNKVVDAHRRIIAWELPCENGDVLVAPPTAVPWVPHERNTWPFHYMTTKVPMTLKIWNQRRHGEPKFTDKPLSVGTRVKIVMVSRFGDVGITDDLTAENGCHLRIDIDKLPEMFENFGMEP